MSSVQYLTNFVNERLTAAVEEILGAFKTCIVQYEEEIDRQRRLLDVASKSEIKLDSLELPQQHVWLVPDQQLCIQEGSSSVDQEDPEPPHIKEEQGELCCSQEGEQLVLIVSKQETASFMVSPTEKSDISEDQTLLLNPDHETPSDNWRESQDHTRDHHGNSESTRDAQPKPKKGCQKSGDSTASSHAPMSTCSSSTGYARRHLSDNNWHFNFEIPWKKMSPEIIRKLERGRRPTKSERLEMIRLMVSEILTICPTPGRKHLSEIARKMAKVYPVAFTDVIEGEIVGSGCDSLTKQMISRVDNLRRGINFLSLKRKLTSTSEGEDPTPRKRRLDTYGCINWQPTRLPPDETPKSQKHVQEELKRMYKERCCDAKSIENKMRATFFTQRKDIISGIETSDLTNEWPYLFETAGMKTHFKELTGVDIDEEAIANKCARVVSYLKCSDKTGKMKSIFREMETSSKNVADVNAAGFLQLLLRFFNEEEDQMLHKVDRTTLPSGVNCAELPSTPCIVVCGSSPLEAECFMLSVDQTIVNSHITVFSDAAVLMFASYYCLNISYPAAQGATLEFLQRCLFRINPDKGSKVEKRSSRKQLALSPKVLSLITKIADYEWRE